MEIVQVNEETCSKCGACAEVCHCGIIDFSDGGFPKPFPVTEQLCTKCGACIIVCPSDSLSHRDIPLDACPPIDIKLNLSFDQCAQFIKSRRSIRKFKSTSVPREEINRIIDAARYAPTGMNAQFVRWLVFDDRDEVEYFREKGADFLIQRIGNSPRLAAGLELAKKRKEVGIDDFLHDAPVIVTTHGPRDRGGGPVNMIAMAYFNLVANSLGIGCCWDGFFTDAANSYPPIKDKIKLPEGHDIFGSMAVGYSKYKYYRVPTRNPGNVTWHPPV